VVRELLGLGGGRRIDVHVRDEEGFRAECRQGHWPLVRELLVLGGDRYPHPHRVSGHLQPLLARQLQSNSGLSAPDFLGLLRDCVVSQAILEAAMKEVSTHAEFGWQCADAQHRIQLYPKAAEAVSHHVLLYALQCAPAAQGASLQSLVMEKACLALNALALCAVLPGAECRHLVGELVGCGAAVPGGEEGRSIWGCLRGGVSVPVDAGAAGVLAGVAVGALLRRVGRGARAAADAVSGDVNDCCSCECAWLVCPEPTTGCGMSSLYSL